MRASCGCLREELDRRAATATIPSAAGGVTSMPKASLSSRVRSMHACPWSSGLLVESAVKRITVDARVLIEGMRRSSTGAGAARKAFGLIIPGCLS
jgi:hypothetical protein